MKRLLSYFVFWKIYLKGALFSIGLPYKLFKSLNFFRHGPNDDLDYTSKTLKFHTDRIPIGVVGYNILELGPGESLLQGVLSFEHGRNYHDFVDQGDFASDSTKKYFERSVLFNGVDFEPRNFRIRYFTEGLKSMIDLNTSSYLCIYSQAVMEHISRHEVEQYYNQMFRLLVNGGYISHQVDLTDHLNGGLNHLTKSNRFYESSFVKKSLNYVNRLSLKQHLRFIENAGFSNIEFQLERSNGVLLRENRINSDYISHFSEDDLTIKGFHVVAQKT